MKYAAFKVSDEDGINSFLATNAKYMAKDGIAFLDGYMCIIYDDRPEAEKSKELMIGSGQAFISQRRAEYLGADVDERYWRRLSIRGEKGVEKNVMEAGERKENLKTQIEKATEIMKEIEADEYQVQ